MGLTLSGIEVSLDLAIIGSIIVAYITWKTAKIKAIQEKEKEEKNRNYVIAIEKMNEIIPTTEKLITFINKMNNGGTISEEDQKLIPELQNLISKSTIDFLGCSEEIMDYVISCNNDIKYIIDNEKTDRGIMFMVYSVVNLTFNLFSNIYGKDKAKSYIESIFPVGNNANNTLDKYHDLRKEFNIKD